MIKLKQLLNEIIHHHHDDMDTEQGAQTMKQVGRQNLDDFTKAYMTAALWSSTTNTNDQGGDPLDKNYGIEDIEEETFKKMVADCKDFQSEYGELYRAGGWSDEQAGHDFWLTRNGHGSGFWDRSHKQPEKEVIGKRLTQGAKQYGEYNLMLGDGAYDGLVVGS